MINFVEKDACNSVEKENAVISRNLLEITKNALSCLLLFPSDAISCFFEKKDLSQNDALSFVCCLRNKLNGNEMEMLTEEEDMFLGKALAVFG